MKLSNNDKNELRQKVVEQLKSVPDGQRIHLDKDLLENLLFDELVCNKETGETVKLPVWSGEFLRKIDLSGVSFDNVSWGLHAYDGPVINDDLIKDGMVDEYFADFIYNKYNLNNDEMTIDYSYTNAKIDFSKSWEAKRGKISIASCNFAGVDLSNNNNIRNIKDIFLCNLSNTNLKLTLDNFVVDHEYSRGAIIHSTNLSCIDLTGITVNAIDMLDEGGYSGTAAVVEENCNLSNTGINIILNPKDFKEQDEQIIQDDGSIIIRNLSKEFFSYMFKKGYLDGCYINGKLMKSKEDRQASAKETRKEYEQMKDGIFGSVIGSIDEQVSHMKR